MPTKNSNTTSVEVNKYPTEKRVQQFRNDPTLLGMTKLNIIAEEKPLKRSAKSSENNDIPERSNQYVEPTSIQSMFSPGRYLCELYNVAKELHKEGEPLHIDKRRPDLKDLSLNQVNMEQEVSTLDILLETLQKGIELSDLSAQTAKSIDGSFTLPYDDNLTIINTVLENKNTSLRNIASLLADNPDLQAVELTPALVQEQLGLNPASYELVKTELAKSDSEHKRLAHAAKLSVKQLEALVTSIKSGGVNEEQVLAVISEYVRLNRQYSLPVDQFIAIFGKINIKEASGNIKNNRIAMISHLFGMNASQIKMLFTLCGKPEALQGATEGNAPHVLTIFSMFENIVQWMNEQKLDLTTLQAMLTDKYSATATPELFNFLSNIYQSVDKSADEKLLKQSLCRSLAAGFHLKTEVATGLVRWLESNDTDFTLVKFNQAVIDVFGDVPTLEKLEHHPQLVSQCQKLSQYVLIAQWVKLTQQDIELLLQPKLINGSEQPLRPSLSLLRLLTEFKSWQQQVKVPVSEALQYFALFGTHTDVNQLKAEQEELENKLAEENKKLKPIENKRRQISDNLESSKKPLHDLNAEIKNIESSIKEKKELIEKINVFFNKDIIDLIQKYTASGVQEHKERRDKYREELTKSTSDLKVKNKDKETITLKIQLLNNALNIINSDVIIEDSTINALKREINSNKKRLNELSQPEERMLVSVHGWDNNQMDDMIKIVLSNQYPVNFMAVNKLCKHINMANAIKVSNQNLLNLKSLALGTDNEESVIKATGEGFITSL